MKTRHFFNNFPYIYVYTKEKVLVYEIFAAYKTDDAHILHTNDFSTKEGRVSYLESIVKKIQEFAGGKGQNPAFGGQSSADFINLCEQTGR